MWSNLRAISKSLLQCQQWATESKRTAFVLRRIRNVKLNKLGSLYSKRLKRKNFYYELEEDTDTKKKPPLELVLLKDVPGIGMLGEKIEINCYIGYRDLLLPKLAVYADSLEAQGIVRTKDEFQYSSIYSKVIEKYLTGQALIISLNPNTEWTLEPWHVKLALRKRGIVTSEECITLPKKPISGPSAEIENKDFIVKLTMNKKETFLIRCRIHNNAVKEITSEEANIVGFCDPLFPEEKGLIESLIKTEEDLKKSLKIRGKKFEFKKK